MAQMSLSDILVQLRKELADAQQKAENQNLKFTVKDIEVELQVSTTLEGNGKVGFKVWLFEGEGGGGISRGQTHTLKLRMEPELSTGGKVQVSAHRSDDE